MKAADFYDESKQSNEDLKVLTNVIQAVHKSSNLDEIYSVALDSVMGLGNVDMAMVYLVDEERREAVLQAQRNIPEDYVRRAGRIPHPKGVTWKAINTGKILNIEDAQKDPDIGPAGRDLGHHGILGIPITLEDTVIGVIWFISYNERKFDEKEVNLLSSLGIQVAIAIAKAKTLEKLELQAEVLNKSISQLSKKNRYEKIISAVTQSVHRSINLNDVMENAVESVKNNMDAVEHIGIYLVEGQEAVLKAHRIDYADWFVERIKRIPYPKGFIWKTIIDGKSISCADVDTDTAIGPAGRQVGIKSYMSIPIRFEENIIGVIGITSLKKNALEEEELKLLEIVAQQIEIAISNAKQAESLRESEERYRTLLEYTHDLIAEASVNGRFLYTNLKHKDVLDYEPEELIGKSIFDYIHPDDYRSVIAEFQRAITTYSSGYAVFRFRHKDGKWLWFESTGRPFRTANGETRALIATRNITERRQAEEDIRESEERYRIVAETASDAIITINEDSTILFVNQSAEKIFGHTPKEILGQPLTMLMPEDMRQIHKASIKLYTETGKRHINWERAELCGLHKSGREIPLEVSFGESVKNGRHIFIGIIRDITERKKAEEALQESELKYRSVVDNIRDVVFQTDAEGTWTFLNRAWTEITGFGLEESIGKNFLDFVHPEDREKNTSELKQLIEREKDYCRYEVRYLTHDGSFRWVEVNARLTSDKEGNILGTSGLLRDITDSKLAEEKIKEQAELLDKAQDAILVQDLEHSIIYWNKSAERLYGWKAEEVIGKHVNQVLYKYDSPHLTEARKKIIKKGEWVGELYMLTKSGAEVVVESRWTLVRDNDEKPKSILVVNTDITEKKRLEAQFFRAQRMEGIGTLAGGIAHDLNNVLAPIMMALGILRQQFTDEKSQKLLDTLEASAERGANLVRQVLSFARGIEGEYTAIQIKHLIAEVDKIAKETFSRSIETRTYVPKDLWATWGDPTQLHQVLMNLCVNARDAMPHGGRLTISAENLFIDENYLRINIDAKVGPYVVITVSDTGIGIPVETIDRIFEPFFTTKEHSKGTGLGLSTVFGIVKSHGGFLNVYSEVGKGTKFDVYLPAIETVETQLVEKSKLELPRGYGELILVIDDEASIRDITRVILEAYGYEVITANDGTEALALYVQNRGKVRAVILDMMMPIMDGSATIRALRKINPKAKIIAASGLMEKEKLAEIDHNTEVQAFLSKPYTADTLLTVLYEVLQA